MKKSNVDRNSLAYKIGNVIGIAILIIMFIIVMTLAAKVYWFIFLGK